MFERSIRKVVMAVRLLDDLSGAPVLNADVRLADHPQNPVKKTDGFYVFTDLAPGSYELLVAAPGYQRFTHTFELPLPNEDRPVLDVPGENEVLLVVESVDESRGTIRFAPRDFFEPLPTDTPVVSSSLVTSLGAELEGQDVDAAPLTDLGTLAADDVVRLVQERVVRLRPGPYYPFEAGVKRLLGSVRDAATGQPLPGARVELRSVNGTAVHSEDVGTLPANTAQIYTTGPTDGKRVIDTRSTVLSTTDHRGRYCLFFADRKDLAFDSVGVVAAADEYTDSEEKSVSLTPRPDHHQDFKLTST